MNIEYNLKCFGENTLIEANLTGPVRNDAWVIFFDNVSSEVKGTKRLYILVEENLYESEINYDTAKTMFEIASKAPIEEFVMSFSTSDPLKLQMGRLFNAIKNVTKAPLAISYHLSKNEARNVIKNVCLSCYTKMISVVKKSP